MAVQELDYKDSFDFIDKHGTKLVWLGREPVDYIRELLDIDSTKMIDADPNKLVYADKEELAQFKDYVFVCYHGNTSRYVANTIKDKAGIESINMKGGVTAVVGEIF